jgi:hypothetical protein
MADIETKFVKIGARVKVTQDPLASLRIDIRTDERGEYFDLRHGTDTQVSVLDVRPHDAHLLVAAVPEDARVKDVQGAKDALKPQEVWDAIRKFRVPLNQRDRRRMAGFVRQGEWFFVPRPELTVDERLVLKNEPIRRGAGKPHSCQYLYRQGGESVHVCAKYPNGLSEREFRALTQKERKAHEWRTMVRDARVFAKGAIRHPDHKTVWLSDWHQVVMNTETRARAMRDVAFLD